MFNIVTKPVANRAIILVASVKNTSFSVSLFLCLSIESKVRYLYGLAAFKEPKSGEKYCSGNKIKSSHSRLDFGHGFFGYKFVEFVWLYT